MSALVPHVLHGSARPIGLEEFLEALKSIAPPRFPLSRGTIHRQVGIAVSGGVDSMALAFLCSQLKRRYPLLKISDNPVSHFYGFVVNHKLRDSSTTEAEKVKSILQSSKFELRAEVLAINWNMALGDGVDPRTRSNLESIARQARYRRLGSAFRYRRIASVLLAHHQDDQYETIMMRLLSGHGYRGLMGIRPATDIPECYDIHGAYQSGFVDDQLDQNPYWNMRPSRLDKRQLRRSLRDEVDPVVFSEEMRAGLGIDVDAAYFDDYDGPSRGAKRAPPPLAPMAVEDGGVILYRPLLEFPKERLIATCLENNVPWFEDHTNADPTLTTRNALRHVYKSHELPRALQKPAILRLAENCRSRVAAEDAEADRRLARVAVEEFEPNVGTAVVRLPHFTLPRVPRRFLTSPARRQKRMEHYRRIAALVVRRLLSLVTPERVLTPAKNLDGVVSRLFPSLSLDAHSSSSSEKQARKSFIICGVHFVPLVGNHATRWFLSRAPYVSNVPRPSVEFTKTPFRYRFKRHPRRWAMGPWTHWELYDGRFWIRVRHRLPGIIIIAPFEMEHAKPLREALADDQARANLAALLKRYAPGKVRFTLPAIYSYEGVMPILRGENYWPAGSGPGPHEHEEEDDAAFEGWSLGSGSTRPVGRRSRGSKSRADIRDELFWRRLHWENEWELKHETQRRLRLLALPTLGVQLPGLEHCLEWETRYRKVDLDLLRMSVAGGPSASPSPSSSSNRHHRQPLPLERSLRAGPGPGLGPGPGSGTTPARKKQAFRRHRLHRWRKRRQSPRQTGTIDCVAH